jgi:hypothetical protein
MASSVLVKRRKITPLASHPCTVPGYYLNFNCEGAPYVEPCFASIGKKVWFGAPSNAQVHGVVHDVSAAQFQSIRKTEGGGGNPGVGYQVAEVEVALYDGKKLKALTLMQAEKIKDFRAYPTRRYMNLLLSGAKENGIRKEYIAYLEGIPAYERPKSIVHIALIVLVTSPFIAVALPVVLLFFIDRKLLTTGRKGPVSGSKFAHQALHFMVTLSYKLNNLIWRHICGNGFLPNSAGRKSK